MSYLKGKLADLFYIDHTAVNLSKSTLGIGIVLVALILLSTIGEFGFTMAFGAVLALNLPEITLLLLWLLVTLLMLAVQNVNYVLYTSILTLNLILFYQLLEADVLFSGLERLFATLLGIALALGVIGLLDYLAKRTGEEPVPG